MFVCPQCAAEWKGEEVIQGEILTCPECGIELEVIGTEPLELAPAPEEQEDWGE
jgi:alpha-aminoadipate carrier protein LysW